VLPGSPIDFGISRASSSNRIKQSSLNHRAMAKPTAESTTAALRDGQAASITHSTAQQMIVCGLIERDQVASR
jgi:hypothetical protein